MLFSDLKVLSSIRNIKKVKSTICEKISLPVRTFAADFSTVRKRIFEEVLSHIQNFRGGKVNREGKSFQSIAGENLNFATLLIFSDK